MNNKPVKTTNHFTGVTKKSNFWEAKVDCVSSCGKAPKDFKVIIEPLVKMKIDTLMEEYTDKEWLAYLIGEENIVSDLFIPEQQANAGSVGNIDCEEYNELNIIGVIHSHHNMGNFFSKTDDDYINGNHNISICVTHNGMTANIRWKTPCGALMEVKSSVVISFNMDFDKEAFVALAKEKIKPFRYEEYQKYDPKTKIWTKGQYNHGYSQYERFRTGSFWDDWDEENGWNNSEKEDEQMDLVDVFEENLPVELEDDEKKESSYPYMWEM